MLEIENLKTNFNTYDGVVKALNGVNLKIEDGEIFDSGFFFTEAPIPFREQKSNISIISLRPPVLLVVILHIVNPMENTSAVIGGHIPTKQIVPRGRNKWKNFSKSTLWFVAIVTRIKSSVPFLRAIACLSACKM